MKDGFQIIEPDGLKELLGNPLHFEFAVAVLSWLIPKLKTLLAAEAVDIDIDIIRVTYLGSYPALGLKYKDSQAQDIAPLVEYTVDKLLHQEPVWDLIAAISSSKVSWLEITKRVMHESR